MLRHFNCSGISDEPLSPEPIRNQENISPFACAILFGKSAIVPPTPPCSDRVMPVRVGFSWKSPMLDMAHISVAVRQSVGPVRFAPLSWFYFSWLLAASRISCVIPARYLVRQLCLAKKKKNSLERKSGWQQTSVRVDPFQYLCSCFQSLVDIFDNRVIRIAISSRLVCPASVIIKRYLLSFVYEKLLRNEFVARLLCYWRWLILTFIRPHVSRISFCCVNEMEIR